jgi:hypothetical protein
MLERALRSDLELPVAMIVDSEMDRLPNFNNGTESLVGDFTVPPGYTLIYASAERGTTENAANLAISHCDKWATQVLKIIQGMPAIGPWGPETPGASRIESPWFSRGRLWDPSILRGKPGP